MKACLSDAPAERPSFADLVTLLHDTVAEVEDGSYANSEGAQTVCSAACLAAAFALPPWCASLPPAVSAT